MNKACIGLLLLALAGAPFGCDSKKSQTDGPVTGPQAGAAGDTAAAGTGGVSAAGGTGASAAGSGDASGASGSGGQTSTGSGAAGSGPSGRGDSGSGGRSTGMGGRGGSMRGGMAGMSATAGSSATAGAPGSGGTSGSGGASGSGGVSASKLFVGNITTSGRVRDDFAMFWDQITPENEGKWGSVEPQRDQMNWAGLDRVYAYAKQNGIPFKQHTLVWGSQQPNWLAGLPAAQQREEVEEWIRLFCERFPDTQMIDVVNEPPPHTSPVYLNAIGGAGASGYDWIVQSFKWARQYCPNAILILNDYNTIEYGGDNTRFIDIVNKIKAAGAPIDAIGAQAHDAYKLSTDTVRGFIDKLAATGLPVYISEYDIDLASDADQQRVMQSQMMMFYDHPSVKGITIWGYVSGATWKPNTGLMSSSGTQRPAMTWLMDFLQR